MSRFALKILAAFFCIATFFVVAVWLSVGRAKGDVRGARIVASEFYARCQRRDYAGARQLLSAERRDVLSPAILAKTWAKFEQKNGALISYKIAEQSPTIYGNRVSIFPRYVEVTHFLVGKNRESGAGMLHLIIDNGEWRIGRLSIVP